MAEESSPGARLSMKVIFGGTETDREDYTHEFFSQEEESRSWKWGIESPDAAYTWMNRTGYNLIVMVTGDYSPQDYAKLEKYFNIEYLFFAEFEDYQYEYLDTHTFWGTLDS